MSVIIQTRGEAGGGVAAHLQCPVCGQFSKSHAHQLSHMAASHPSSLDGVAVGRLGNILMYQGSGRLFHCFDCFYTSRDFSKLYKHIISKHCMDQKEEQRGDKGKCVGGGGDGMEKGVEKIGEEEKAGVEGNGEKTEEGKQEKTGEEGEEETEGGKQEKTEGEGEDDKTEEGKQVKTEEVKQEKKGKEGKQEKTVEEGKVEKTEEEGKQEKTGGEVEEQKTREEGGAENPNRGIVAIKEEEEGEGPAGARGEENLALDGVIHRCLICSWKSKLKSLCINHVMQTHDIPKMYATQAVKREGFNPKQTQCGGSGVEEDEVAQLTGELLKEELEATAKVVRFISNRFVCQICGWKTKLKGFAISHVVRCHDVERPYTCKDCQCSFFLPSRLQQHVSTFHRPGRYACPFCCFRSHYLGGFRRHCSRCNAREGREEGGGGGGGGGIGGGGVVEEEENEGEEEEEEERRGSRKRRRTSKVLKEVVEDYDDDDDD